jgi:hypothetical protein
MCTAEGSYIDAVKIDGSKVKIFWWDLGNSVPWKSAARYADPFPFTTVFAAEGWEEWSQIETKKALLPGGAQARSDLDRICLEKHGVRCETVELMFGAMPIPFEGRHAGTH